MDVGFAAVEHVPGEVDAELALRVDQCIRARRAAPAEFACGRQRAAGGAAYQRAHAQTVAVADHLRPVEVRHLRGRKVVFAHQLDGRGRQDAFAGQTHAAARQRVGEADVIVHRGHQPRAAAVVVRAEHIGAFRVDSRHAALVPAVLRRQTLRLRGREVQRAHRHAQRLEQVFLHIGFKPHAADHLNRRGQHVQTQAVLPVRAGIEAQPARGDRARDFARGRAAVRGGNGTVDFRRFQVVVQPRRHREQVSHADFPLRRTLAHAPLRVRLVYLQVPVFRKIFAERVAHQKRALLKQLKRAYHRERLRAGIGEIRLVAPHGRLRLAVAEPGGVPENAPVRLIHRHIHARNAHLGQGIQKPFQLGKIHTCASVSHFAFIIAQIPVSFPDCFHSAGSRKCP